MKTVALLILCFVLLIGCHHTILFVNDYNKPVIYNLYRIDHNVPNRIYPVSMAVGELQPGASNTIERESGKYFVEWYDYGRALSVMRGFTLDGDKKFVYRGEGQNEE